MRKTLRAIYMLVVANLLLKIQYVNAGTISCRDFADIETRSTTTSWSYPSFKCGWESDWNFTKKGYNPENRALVVDSDSDTTTVLQVRYNAGGRTGTGFHAAPIDMSEAKGFTFEYSVFFPDSFNFVNGGKLPGILGGTHSCSGGDPALDCFSTRLMFRKAGAGEIYLYANQDVQTASLCKDNICNDSYGISIGRGNFTFATGEWTTLKQVVTLNTFTNGKYNKDGTIKLYVNGATSPAIYFDTLVYRTEETVVTSAIDFETFFGGSGSSYYTPTTQYSYFKGFSLELN